jgi:hypothetical protein
MDQPSVVLEMPEPQIAGQAKEATHHAGVVRMIDAQVLLRRLAADEAAAALRLQHLLVLLGRQAVAGQNFFARIPLAAQAV